MMNKEKIEEKSVFPPINSPEVPKPPIKKINHEKREKKVWR